MRHLTSDTETATATPDADYTPISVGFDLRKHDDMVIALPADVRSVRYDLRGSAAQVNGTRKEIVAALVAAGYRVSFDRLF